jgi:hypothetical protein
VALCLLGLGAAAAGLGCVVTSDGGSGWYGDEVKRSHVSLAIERSPGWEDRSRRARRKALAALQLRRGKGGRLYRRGWAWPRGAPYHHAPPDYRYPVDSDDARSRECLARLDATAIRYRRAPPVRAIMTPVHVLGDIGGVRFRLTWRRRAPPPMLVDCEMALALWAWSAILRAQDVVEVRYSNTWRRAGRPSRRRRGYPHKHAMGYAIDVHQLVLADGRRLDIERDYERLLGDEQSCLGQPRTDAGRILRTIVCQTAASTYLIPPINPDDNWDHRNHLHVEGTSLAERRQNHEEVYGRALAWRRLRPRYLVQR